MKLSKVALKDGGVHAPGNGHGGHRKDRFDDALFDLSWDQESRAICIRDKANGLVRYVDQGNCQYWDPVVAVKPEGKK